VAVVKEEKSRLIDELLECERQVVLWERKIVLEKETQEALDPTVGESEIASMEVRIGRQPVCHLTPQRAGGVATSQCHTRCPRPRAPQKDIHRMRLRFDAVKREQERLVGEMERAIEKREVSEQLRCSLHHRHPDARFIRHSTPRR